MKGLLIRADGVMTTIEPSPGKDLFQCIESAIGGFEMVRPVHLRRPYCMVVDDSGLLKEKPVNITGSALYGTHEHGSPIVGDIVILREDFGSNGPDVFWLSDEEVKTLAPELLLIRVSQERERTPARQQ